MPFEIKFLDCGIGVLLSGKGHATGQELIDALTEIYRSEEQYLKYKYSIVDLTSVEKVDVSNAEIMMISEKHKGIAKKAQKKIVAMAATKDITFGLSRMWQAYTGEIKWDIAIVRSRDEAKSWVKEKVKSIFNIDLTLE